MAGRRDEIMNTIRFTGIQVKEGKAVPIDDTVVKEERFSLFLNGSHFTDLVASANQVEALGAGFVVCQGLSKEVNTVAVTGSEIRVRAPISGALEKEIATTGSIGVKGCPPGKVVSDLSITIDEVYGITREIVTDLWRQTGGVHCSVLFHDGAIVARSSDVGRHNTVDKVIGHAVLSRIPLGECVIGCTGRQPRDMVIKYANAGVPIVISRAATTDRGIAAADEFGITLICFSRQERFTVYTHPSRIRGL
ncbi:MAG TPA: formate dehydrogenase accessory sulfurtransferase FdhD [Methanoregulaceae archaeon]|nr:formate dehydrogenase accessory sulfurtransferase FdhD [Methanoregulaceae archaeon]HPW11108.1 formate dehydrogenase accessory sulfurtransferase FdhD [Methanoregulaceae archaeon]HQM56122.1 formate dehydrogenase accessory sulfurtransferase FdhD [Methanoregulaceae archaeon]